MVDGHGIGDNIIGIEGGAVSSEDIPQGETSNYYAHLSSNYTDADLIVIESGGQDRSVGLKADHDYDMRFYKEKDGGDYTILEFKAYAIYGSKVVSTTISEEQIHGLKQKGQKYVWASRKPYILSGD